MCLSFFVRKFYLQGTNANVIHTMALCSKDRPTQPVWVTWPDFLTKHVKWWGVLHSNVCKTSLILYKERPCSKVEDMYEIRLLLSSEEGLVTELITKRTGRGAQIDSKSNFPKCGELIWLSKIRLGRPADVHVSICIHDFIISQRGFCV